jgi:ABC-type dipeptide/oligopeptide/nickel transport system permease component
VKQYILRRIALAVPTLIIVSVIVFAIMRLMPGDVVIRMVEATPTRRRSRRSGRISVSTGPPTCSTSTG